LPATAATLVLLPGFAWEVWIGLVVRLVRRSDTLLSPEETSPVWLVSSGPVWSLFIKLRPRFRVCVVAVGSGLAVV